MSEPPPSTFAQVRKGTYPPDISLMIKLVLTVRGFRGQLDERLRRMGHSVSQMETLAAIMSLAGPDRQNPRPQIEVARRLRVEGATITRMIDVLAREGLVARMPDTQDRRVNLLTITPAGEAALEQIFGVYDNLRNHVLADLGEQEKALMHKALDAMLGRIDAPPKD